MCVCVCARVCVFTCVGVGVGVGVVEGVLRIAVVFAHPHTFIYSFHSFCTGVQSLLFIGRHRPSLPLSLTISLSLCLLCVGGEQEEEIDASDK